MKVMYIPADGRAELRNIPNDLPAYQALVGGYIETAPIGHGLLAIVNEEGAINGMPANRALPYLHGPVVVVHCMPGDENWSGLHKDEIKMLLQMLTDTEPEPNGTVPIKQICRIHGRTHWIKGVQYQECLVPTAVLDGGGEHD